MDETPYTWNEAGPSGFDCEGLLDAADQAASFWTGIRVRGGMPLHAPDCALATTHHLTCTCGATTRAVREAKGRLAGEQPQ
jgi:hypothetical protein